MGHTASAGTRVAWRARHAVTCYGLGVLTLETTTMPLTATVAWGPEQSELQPHLKGEVVTGQQQPLVAAAKNAAAQCRIPSTLPSTPPR